MAQAREQCLDLIGEGGLLRQLTKRVLESALEGGTSCHLGRPRDATFEPKIVRKRQPTPRG